MLAVARGCGRVALAAMGIERFRGGLDREILSIALGMVVLAVACAGMALSSLLYSTVAWFIFCVLAAVGLFGTFSRRYQEGAKLGGWRLGGCSILSVCLSAVLLAFAIFNLISNLVPSLNNDTLAIYFWVPKVWIRDNALSDVFTYQDNLIFWFPLLHAYCMLLCNDILASLFNTYWMGILSAGAVFILARRSFNREVALLSSTILYSGYVYVWLNHSGRSNLAMAFFELLSLYCFFTWLDLDVKCGKKWIVLSGIFGGFAAGIHVAGLKTVLVVALLFLVCGFARGKRGFALRLRPSLLFIIVSLVFVSPIFIRNIILFRNPAYPFLSSVFGGVEYTGLCAGQVLDRGQAQPGFRSFFFILYDITVKPWYVTRSHMILPLIVMFAPFIVLMKRVDRRLWLLLGIAFLLYVEWFFTQRFARYGLNFISLLSIVAAYVICTLITSRYRLIKALTLCSVFLVLGLELERDIRYSHRDTSMLKCALGLMPRDEYIYKKTITSSFYPNFHICQYINRYLGEGAKVFGTSEELKYWFDRPYISVKEIEGNDIYYQKDAVEMLRRLKQNGITHVLFSQKYIGEINRHMRRSGIYEQFLPDKSLFLEKSFTDKYLNKLYEDRGDILYEVLYPADGDGRPGP